MSKMSEKMYGSSPKMERDEEDGKVKVKKANKAEADTSGEAEDQGAGQSVPMEVRHSMERHEMHHAHEREHHMHDMGKGGDKKEMHSRHLKQHEDMMKRHEKEMNSKEKEMGGKEKEKE